MLAALVYFGLIVTLLGSVSIIRPPAFLGIHNRLQGGFVFAVGLLITGAALMFPASERRVATLQTQLDHFAPLYQFNEVHFIRIRAPKDRVYEAIRAVTADEIPFYRVLTWVRRLGRGGSESILDPPKESPLLDVATRTGFIVLAEEPEHEIVIGAAVVVPPGWRPKKSVTPEDFKAVHTPGFAIATMNFLITDESSGACTVTTETRVYATDSSTRRRFAGYWRVIYPGSALIRRMWLRAIKRRAQTPADWSAGELHHSPP